MKSRWRIVLLVTSLALLACSTRARSNGNPPELMQPGLPRAGVPIEPAARHGGLVSLAGLYPVEMVVAPDGVVRVYPRDHDGNDIAPGGTSGVVRERDAQGVLHVATLRPERSTGAMRADLPPPTGERTEYDADLSIENHRASMGIAVIPGGSAPTLALQQQDGDRPVIPDATDRTLAPAVPPSAIGGGPTGGARDATVPLRSK